MNSFRALLSGVKALSGPAGLGIIGVLVTSISPSVLAAACRLAFRLRAPSVILPPGPSAHELRVALGARYYDIHPDPHGLWGWRHHVVKAVVSLHTEGQRWVGALEDFMERVRFFCFVSFKKATCTCCIFTL